MVDFLLQVVWETWLIFKEAAVFLLFGFAFAGILAVMVPSKTLLRFFGTGKVRSVLWASALGVPLPLCSCGVLPTALGLRRQGATKGATVSFLIATPETGVDSISLSYALMDPIITVFRPAAAVVTAVAAGLATNFFGEPRARKGDVAPPVPPAAADDAAVSDVAPGHDHGHDHDRGHDLFGFSIASQDGDGAAKSIARRGVRTVREIYGYAFRELLDETSYWLVLGIVLSGVVAALLPATFFERYLSGELTSMIAMLVIGIPIYTCASSSTPIAAALVLKGLNPGAALVFLLAGPATNIGSLIVLLKFLGARVVAIYLGAIVIVTLLAGYGLNWVYRFWDLDARATFGTGTGFIPESVKIAAAVALIVLLLVSMWRTHVPGEWFWLRDKLALLTGVRLSTKRLAGALGVAIAALYLSSGLTAVQPGEVAIKTTFGRITEAALGPGIHYRWPWPFESHRIVQQDRVRRIELGFRSAAQRDLAERALARGRLTVGGPSNPVPNAIQSQGFWFQKDKVVDESFLLTGDTNLLDVGVTVHYRVRDPVAFAYGLTDAEALVRALALAVLRETVGTSAIDAIYTVDRGDVESRVTARLEQLLDRHASGMEIVAVRLLYVHPPDDVHGAFRDVASAQEDKIHIMNRALTFAVEKVNLAQGDAAAMIEDALAFKEEKVLRAEGDAEAFTRKVDEYERAPDLTRFRLNVEAIEDVLPKVRKVLRPGATDVKDMDFWLLEPFSPGAKD